MGKAEGGAVAEETSEAVLVIGLVPFRSWEDRPATHGTHGGVPVVSGPAAAAEKKESAQRHAGYSNHNPTTQTT